MKTPVIACYWIVGSKTDAPAVAVDLHDSNSELTHETWTAKLPMAGFESQAEEVARAYAARYGITGNSVHYDPDSTQYFARC